MNRVIFLVLTILFLCACKKKETLPKSSAKVIRSFTFYKSNNPLLGQDYAAVITHDTILITLSDSVNITNLIPNIGYVGASLSPGSQVAQNFTHSILYTVTAEDGSTATYKTVVHALSDSSAITSFVFKQINNPALANDIAGVITGDSILVKVPRGVDVTSLKPTIVYTGIDISPGNEQPENFSNIIAYAVGAEDGSWRNYNVYVESHYDIFIHSDDGYLYDINASNGSVKWKSFVGGNGVPTYDNGVVFVAGYTNFTTVVYAINADDGSLKWSSNQLQGNYTLSIPVIKYGKVYFGGNGLLNDPTNMYAYYAGFIYAINGETGAQEWFSTYITSNGSITMGNTNVTVEDNIACIYDVYYGLHVFNAVDVTSLWAVLGELGRANPAIANNSFVCGIEGGIAETDE